MPNQNNSSHSKGEKRIKTILTAAENILIDSGYHNFSMRKVAAKAKISVGNLQYYFPTKDSLLNALLDNVIKDYLETFEKIRSEHCPKDQFIQIIENVVLDLKTKRTTIFFPELWSMSNHDKNFSKCIDIMYGKYRSVLQAVIKDINPSLSDQQAMRLSLFISSSLEGHTIFIGYKKAWTEEVENIEKIALQSFLWLIENGDIPD